MIIQVEQKEKYVLVTLHGRIDSFNLEIVKNKLRTLVRSGKKFIALEMSAVDFVSLAATLEIENLSHQLFEQKGKLYILGENQRTSLLKRTFIENVCFVPDEKQMVDVC